MAKSGWDLFSLESVLSYQLEREPLTTTEVLSLRPTRLDPSLTLTRTQYPATVGNTGNRKPLTYAEIASPVQRSSTTDRTLVAGAGVSGSSPLVGFLLCP